MEKGENIISTNTKLLHSYVWFLMKKKSQGIQRNRKVWPFQRKKETNSNHSRERPEDKPTQDLKMFKITKNLKQILELKST